MVEDKSNKKTTDRSTTQNLSKEGNSIFARLSGLAADLLAEEFEIKIDSKLKKSGSTRKMGKREWSTVGGKKAKPIASRSTDYKVLTGDGNGAIENDKSEESTNLDSSSENSLYDGLDEVLVQLGAVRNQLNANEATATNRSENANTAALASFDLCTDLNRRTEQIVVARMDKLDKTMNAVLDLVKIQDKSMDIVLEWIVAQSKIKSTAQSDGNSGTAQQMETNSGMLELVTMMGSHRAEVKIELANMGEMMRCAMDIIEAQLNDVQENSSNMVSEVRLAHGAMESLFKKATAGSSKGNSGSASLESALVDKLTQKEMMKEDFKSYDGAASNIDSWVHSVDMAIRTHSGRYGGDLAKYQNNSIPLIGKKLTGQALTWFEALMQTEGTIGYSEFIKKITDRFTIASFKINDQRAFRKKLFNVDNFPAPTMSDALSKWKNDRDVLFSRPDGGNDGEMKCPEFGLVAEVWSLLNKEIKREIKDHGDKVNSEDPGCPYSTIDVLAKQLTIAFGKSDNSALDSWKNNASKGNKNGAGAKPTNTAPVAGSGTNSGGAVKSGGEKTGDAKAIPVYNAAENTRHLTYLMDRMRKYDSVSLAYMKCFVKTSDKDHKATGDHDSSYCKLNPFRGSNMAAIEKEFGKDWMTTKVDTKAVRMSRDDAKFAKLEAMIAALQPAATALGTATSASAKQDFQQTP